MRKRLLPRERVEMRMTKREKGKKEGRRRQGNEDNRSLGPG